MGSRGPQKALKATNKGRIPACPFTKKARPDDYASWQKIVKLIEAGGLATAYAASDAIAIERCAVLYTRAIKWSKEAARIFKAGTLYVETRSNGEMPHPGLREERAAWDALDKALKDLGLTPRARAELVVDDASDDLDDLEETREQYLRAVK